MEDPRIPLSGSSIHNDPILRIGSFGFILSRGGFLGRAPRGAHLYGLRPMSHRVLWRFMPNDELLSQKLNSLGCGSPKVGKRPVWGRFNPYRPIGAPIGPL